MVLMINFYMVLMINLNEEENGVSSSGTDSGTLIQIQAFCYGFRHSDTDSGILIRIQAFWYRFRHL